jgi:hypothetical protein
MRWTLKQSIQSTLVYSGLFDFPLTEDEIVQYLIVPKGQKVGKITKSIVQEFPHIHNYFSDKQVKKRVSLRKLREEYAQRKWKIAKHAAFWLSFIPSIDVLGISGGLSLNNADEQDDIDLFIICYPGTIWSTRLFVLLFLDLLGRRRKFGEKVEKDLICPNMFITNGHLRLLMKLFSLSRYL